MGYAVEVSSFWAGSTRSLRIRRFRSFWSILAATRDEAFGFAFLEEKRRAGLISDAAMRKICDENAEKLFGKMLFDDENATITDTPCGRQFRAFRSETLGQDPFYIP